MKYIHKHNCALCNGDGCQPRATASGARSLSHSCIYVSFVQLLRHSCDQISRGFHHYKLLGLKSRNNTVMASRLLKDSLNDRRHVATPLAPSKRHRMGELCLRCVSCEEKHIAAIPAEATLIFSVCTRVPQDRVSDVLTSWETRWGRLGYMSN